MKAREVILFVTILASCSIAQTDIPRFRSKVPTVGTRERAEKRAIEALTGHSQNLIKQDEIVIARLFFVISEDIAGFAEMGDRIWQVHFMERESNQVRRIAWINADTEKVIIIFPKSGTERKVTEQGRSD